MKSNSRLILYILINILISAVTTLTVLWIWEKAHPMPDPFQPIPATVNQNTEGTENNSPSDIPSIDLLNENIDVIIRTVVGAGDLNVEYVEIYNQSNGAVDMTGWQLVDNEDQRFIFPTLILNSGGAIKVYSKNGNNTVIELYWQADAPVWQSGETVSLLDSSSDLIATYSIP